MSTIADIKLNRRSFVLGSLMLGAASPFVLSACSSEVIGGGSSGGGGGGGTINWLTWSDHYSTDQLAKVASSTKITGHPKLFSDNADAFLQLKQTGPQFDQVSADALWVKKYMESGLIQPFDLSSIGASSELYSMAKNFDFLNDPKGAIGYPFSWSTVQIYYNPAKVKTPPTTWESLTDPQYKGLIVAENIPTDLMAIAGIATGSKSPYALTPDQISKAADWLSAIKPNMIKLATQNNEIISMMASGEAAIGISNLGTESASRTRVAPSSSGVPAGRNDRFHRLGDDHRQGQQPALVKPFLDAMQRSEFIVENFTTNWRPLFNEKAAKALTADPKTADAAKRLFMDNPEKALSHDPEGPGPGSAGLHRGVQPGLRGLT